MAPPLPVVLAEVGDASGLLSLLTALAVVLLSGGAWVVLRRRRARAASAVLVLGALLVLGAFLPRPAFSYHDHVEGFLTGEARVPVSLAEGAPVRVEGEGGEARVEEGQIVLRCPARCRFHLGADPAWGARAWARTDADAQDGLEVELRGGPLQVKSVHSVCQRLPLLLAWMRGGDPCAPCHVREWLAGAGHDGTLRLQAAPSPVC